MSFGGNTRPGNYGQHPGPDQNIPHHVIGAGADNGRMSCGLRRDSHQVGRGIARFAMGAFGIRFRSGFISGFAGRAHDDSELGCPWRTTCRENVGLYCRFGCLVSPPCCRLRVFPDSRFGRAPGAGYGQSTAFHSAAIKSPPGMIG